jgi:hypothetical protein
LAPLSFAVATVVVVAMVVVFVVVSFGLNFDIINQGPDFRRRGLEAVDIRWRFFVVANENLKT